MVDIRIALLGFGNAARAFATSKPDLPIVAVADSTCALVVEGPRQMEKLVEHKASGRPLREYPMAAPILDVPDFVARLQNLCVDVLVESLPTNLEDGQPALNWIENALRCGVPVVTVDKGPPGVRVRQAFGSGAGVRTRLPGNNRSLAHLEYQRSARS